MRTFHDIIWVGNLCWSTQHKMIEQDSVTRVQVTKPWPSLWRLHNSSTKLMWWWSKVVSCKVTNARTKTMSVEQLALREVYKKIILLTECKYHHGNFPQWSFNKPEEQLLKLVSVVSWNIILILAIPYKAIYHVFQTCQYWAYLAYCTSFLVSFTATISLLAKSMLAFAVVAVTVLSLYPPVAVFLAFGDVVR